MEKKREDRIIIVLSSKGYVAVENGQIFQLWKNKCLKDIYEELQFRYSNYNISLGSLERVKFKEAIEVCEQFIKYKKQPETLSILEKDNISQTKINIIYNKALVTGINKMKTRQKAKVKAVIVIGINVTAGVLHLGFQSMAELICFSEAKLIDKINVFDKTVDEIMKARRCKTKETQQYLLKSPNRMKQTASKFYCRIKDIKEQARVKSEEIIKTV